METIKKSAILKAFAAVTAAAMLTVILLSGLFIVLEADHDCEGEDCHICHCLEQCQAILNQIGEAVSAGKTAFFTAVLLLASCFHLTRVICKETPVTIKVRLND